MRSVGNWQGSLSGKNQSDRGAGARRAVNCQASSMPCSFTSPLAETDPVQFLPGSAAYSTAPYQIALGSWVNPLPLSGNLNPKC